MITVDSGVSRRSTFGSVIAATSVSWLSRSSRSGLPSTRFASTASNWARTVGAASSRSAGSAAVTTSGSLASAARTASRSCGSTSSLAARSTVETRFAITAITFAWWARNSANPPSAAERMSSGVRLRPETTRITGVFRFAATRALNVSSVGEVVAV